MKKVKTKEELKKLQGTWNVVALEVQGQKMAGAALLGSKIVVQGKRFTTIAMGATYEGTLEVDATKTPNALNMMFTAGPEKGNTNFGIYKLAGDTWKICLSITGRDRPKKFASAPGSGHALETLKRETHANRQRPDQSASGQRRSGSKEKTRGPQGLGNAHLEPAPELEGEWSMVSGTYQGEALPEAFVKSGKRVARGNETTTLFGGQVFMRARFTIDRSKQPNAIDYLLTYGPGEGKTQYGIYELEGKTLKFCFTGPGQERPTDFKTVQGDGRTLTVWRLVKK